MILWLIACGFCFVAGMLHGQGKLIPWVRGAAGKARGVVFGLRPARTFSTGILAKSPDGNTEIASAQPDIQPDTNLGQFTQTPHKPPITAGKAFANILAFFGGLLAWMAKNPIVAIGLVLLAFVLVFGFPFGLGKSKGELRLEREIAEREAQFQQTLRERDEAITAIRTETARTLAQIRLESQRGHDAIAAATPEHEEEIDPALVAAFRDALDGLCVPRADGTRSDTCRS